MKKVAFITGINGQDGSYLAEFLLEKGYEVHGTLKRNSVSENQTSRIDSVFDKLKLHYADLTDLSSLTRVIQEIKPTEIYNLAAQSHVRISFDQPIYTANVTGLGTLNLLEAVKLLNKDIKNRLDNITLYGDGTPLRQFMYAGDFAEIIKQTIENNITDSFNVSTEENFSIRQMAEIALEVTDNKNIKILWDKEKPNGQFRKDVSIDKFKGLFPDFKFTPLSDGIKIVYKTYYDKVS